MKETRWGLAQAHAALDLADRPAAQRHGEVLADLARGGGGTAARYDCIAIGRCAG